MDDMLMDEPPQIPEANMSGADMPGADMAGGDLNSTAMMDAMIDDDLFGEAPDALGVPMTMPSTPLPASVITRVNDMQRTGCCSRLAWSNAGFVAAITSDGSKISFRTNVRDAKSGDWKLSPESQHTVVAPGGARFVHVQFNGLGTDLAAADNVGGVHLYGMLGVLGRMQLAPADQSVNEGDRTELDAVVALQWLPSWPSEFRAPFISPATKIGDRWTNSVRMPDPNIAHVHHALDNRNALLYVTRSSKVVLLYQTEQNVWHSVSVQAEEWHTSDDLLTHAAIGEDGERLILITHDRTRRFRVYNIGINWNKAQHPGGPTIVAPVLGLGHLTMVDRIAPQHAELAKLSALRIMPAIPPHANQGMPTSTTVLAVFVYSPAPINGVQQQDAFSIISTWTLDSVTPTLHKIFTKMKLNAPVPVQPATTVLRRQPDVMTNRVVLDAAPLYFNTMVAFAGSTGVVELYDRLTWTVIEPIGDTFSSSSLPQSGLEYTSDDHTAHIALNADASSMVFKRPDDTLSSKHVSLRYGWEPLEDGISDTKGLVETALVSLARQYAILCWSSAASDETLAIVPQNLSKAHRVFFAQQVFRILCRNLDVSMFDHARQQQTVLREQMHIRALGAQLVLGIKPGSGERDFAGQFAYTYLNMRQIAFILAQTFSSKDREGWSRQPDLVPSLIGLSRWITDLIIYISDTLAQVKRNMQPNVSAKEAFQRLIMETGNPSIILLLSSFSRIILRMMTMVMKTYIYSWVPIALKRPRSIELKEHMQEFLDAVKRMPFKHEHFVELIMEFDAAVRNAYTESGASPEQRLDIELAMITEGTIPEELAPALQTLLDTGFPKLTQNADMGTLYFWDTEWLGISSAVQQTRYDAVRKVPLRKGMKVRVCRRCGAEMEDLSLEPGRQLPDWLKHGQRHCYCQGYWWSIDD